VSRRTALVTGASQGIGAATARALAADGYHVIVHYGGSKGKAEAVAAQIAECGGSAELVQADLAEPDAAHKLAAEVARRCGGRLDALVLNAGVMDRSDFADCTPETFDRIYHVNLRTPFFLVQQLTPTLVDGASIVFVSSVTAKRVTGGVAAYASMKASLESFIRRAAMELGPRWIRVNGVAPATTANDMIKPWTDTDAGREATVALQALKRVAEPEDIADVIAFLCSDKARWIDGALIPVDGGTLL